MKTFNILPSKYRHCICCLHLTGIVADESGHVRPLLKKLPRPEDSVSEGNVDMLKFRCKHYPVDHFSPDDSVIHTCPKFYSVFRRLKEIQDLSESVARMPLFTSDK